MPLIPVDDDLLVDPRFVEPAIILNPACQESRRIWITTPIISKRLIEVDRRYHRDLLQAWNLDLPR